MPSVPKLAADELHRRLDLLDEVRLFQGVPAAEAALGARLATVQTLADGEF